MYFVIYKITNNIDGKIYIGSHKTNNLNDNYMGSGKLLKRAQKKYGLENFKKDILFTYDNPKEMYLKESEIVNEEFLMLSNTYNLKLGGFGGWDCINNNTDLRISKNRKARVTTNTLHKDKLLEWSSKGGKSNIEKHGINSNFIESGKTSFLGKNHSDEAKLKIGIKNSKSSSGKGNSQYGTMWITNGIENKKIKKDAHILDGWVKGRKY